MDMRDRFLTSTERSDAGTSLRRVAILKNAIRLFHEKGYRAASMRELAHETGIEAASLYNHFVSKQELLAEVLTSAIQILIDGIRAAASAAESHPAQRLRAAIAAYVLFHEEHLALASISSTELRDLDPDGLRRVLALRHELDAIFKQIIADGVRAGVFAVENTGITVMAILSICARIPSWYRPGGPQDLHEIAEVITGLVLRIVGARNGRLNLNRKGKPI